MFQILANIAIFTAGLLVVLFTLNAVVRTFMLPRGENVLLTRILFRNLARFFRIWIRFSRDEENIERVWAMFTPIALLILPLLWLALVTFGFMGMFWAIGVRPWSQAFLLSGSSLLTLGFAPVANMGQTVLAFLDAAIGLVLIALLIAYLPTMYNAFSRREILVAKLEVYAGLPPDPVEIIARMHRIHGIEYLNELWGMWETWFAEVDETQTTFSPLNFFRSPKPARHWVTAGGAILDAAALVLSTLNVDRQPRAALCIRSGYLAFRSIADFFGFEYDKDPKYGQPVNVSREEFETACDRLAGQGVDLVADRDKAYMDYSGWRVNYEATLLAVAAITNAPLAPWSSDRAKMLPFVNRKRRRI